jgi:phosphoglycolate phosphatase-like HAD superfamily hydrolase
MDCYIFDIDGTLADCSHRLHFIQGVPKLWDAFFEACVDDKPIEHVIHMADSLWISGAAIVYVSGRSDQVRRSTLDWLREHGLPAGKLYMRKQGDHRPDHVVKMELLDQLIADGYKPRMAFDDRNQVVKMWRERGIPCAQVAEGDF